MSVIVASEIASVGNPSHLWQINTRKFTGNGQEVLQGEEDDKEKKDI